MLYEPAGISYDLFGCDRRIDLTDIAIMLDSWRTDCNKNPEDPRWVPKAGMTTQD